MNADKYSTISLLQILILIVINISFSRVNAEVLDSVAVGVLVTNQGTDIVIPNNYTIVGNYAFSNYSGLTSITIGNSVIARSRDLLD